MEYYPLCLLTREPLLGSDNTLLLLNTEPHHFCQKKKIGLKQCELVQISVKIL